MILASSTASASGGMMSMIIMKVALIAIMYFIMIRPQRKEQKRLDAMLRAMEPGDAVVTTSGFYGVVIDVGDEDVIVEFGNNRKCRIPMKKQAISQVEKPADAVKKQEKSAPAKKDAKAEDKKK